MKFIDLNAQQARIKVEIDAGIQRVLAHGQYVNGPEITALENDLAHRVGVKHAISCSSGTTALQLSLMALDIGLGDEVITTSFSFFATSGAIKVLGATPVFVDIDPVTFNIDPSLIEAAITDRTKAIMPVSLYGQCADFAEINLVAKKHHLPVIEDGAQSLGATHHGKQSCGLSTIGCTSFFPSKPLGCYGDGGCCFTDDTQLAKKMRMLRDHGQGERYVHELIGLNGRMDTLQAAILLAKLSIFDEEISLRQQVAAYYATHLPHTMSAPAIELFNTSVYGQYTVRVKDRDGVQADLKNQGIPTAVHYPILMNNQPALSNISAAQQVLPVAECAAKEVLSLPFFPYMAEGEVISVCEALRKTR